MTPSNERGNLAVLCLEAGLTRMESSVMMAHYGDGWSRDETAARLGISRNAVNCHISNAGKRIRENVRRAAWREQIHEQVSELRRCVEAARSATAP